MFRNYNILNPLTNIFNFVVIKNCSLKRKAISDVNICPRKQKAYAPTGFIDVDKDELDAKYSISSETVFKDTKTNELDGGNFVMITNIAKKNCAVGDFGDNRNVIENDRNLETNATSGTTDKIEATEMIEGTETSEDTETSDATETTETTETENETNQMNKVIEVNENLVVDADNLPNVEDVLNLLENKVELVESEKTKRKNYEYLLAKQYSVLNEHDVPRIKIKTSNDFHHRAHSAFRQHCTKVFDNPQIYDINSIEEIWGRMSLCRKFPYYWLAANCQQLSKNAFENYLNFHKRLPKYNTKSTNMQSLLNNWKKMSYDEKLPFIFETYLVHMSAAPKLFKEHNMQLFFEMEKRKH